MARLRAFCFIRCLVYYLHPIVPPHVAVWPIGCCSSHSMARRTRGSSGRRHGSSVHCSPRPMWLRGRTGAAPPDVPMRFAQRRCFRYSAAYEGRSGLSGTGGRCACGLGCIVAGLLCVVCACSCPSVWSVQSRVDEGASFVSRMYGVAVPDDDVLRECFLSCVCVCHVCVERRAECCVVDRTE